MKKWRTGILLLVGFLIMGILAGCGQTERAAEPPAEIKVALVFQPGNLDPARSWNGWFIVKSGMGETLVRLNEEMKLEPWLAKSWRQIDELSWEVELRENVKFHNGDPVDAQAVKASLERCLRLNERAPGLLKIRTITARDNKLIIQTTEPNPALPNYLADPMTVVVNAREANRMGDDFALQPVLTGPYKLQDYQKDVHVVVEKNPHYWGTPPRLQRVTFKFVPDGMSRAMALQSGDVQIAKGIPVADIPAISETPGLRVLSNSSLRVHMIFLNLTRSPLDDLNVRRAINMAVNREALAEDVMHGGAIAAVGPFPSVLPFGSASLAGYDYNPEQARELLEKAGWKMGKDNIREKDGEKLALTLYTYKKRPELPVIAEAVQAQLAEVGIAVKIQVVESVTKILKSGDYDMAIYSINTAPTGDPYYFLNLVFRTGGPSNFNMFSNPEADKLIDLLGESFDVNRRCELARKAQEVILAQAPAVFLVYPKITVGVSEKITGYTVHPSEFYLLQPEVGIK